MNGIVLLMLMATAGQVAAPVEAERDFGWEINKKDNVLEYIIQLSPEKVRDMQQKSIAFPLGQENLSDIPPQLVGRATRVVIRIGDAVLPRTPSLQELERLPRSGDPVPSSTAQLGPGRISDVEPGVYNIQGNGQPPSLPDYPSASSGALLGPASTLGTASGLPDLPQSGNLIDEASRVANTLRDGMNEGSAAGALPSSPNLSMLAQNTPSPLAQNDNAFLQGSRGASSKFNNTGTPAASTPLPANPNLMTNPTGNAGAANPGSSQPREQSRWGQTNSNVASGTGTGALPGYPGTAALNPPSLNQYSNALPQQQTPTPTFGSSPTYTGRQTNGTGSNAANLNYAQPGMAPLNDGYAQSGPYAGMSNTAPYQQNSGVQQLPQSTLGTSSFSNQPQSGSSFVTGTGTQNSGYDRLAMNNNLGAQSQTVPSPSNQTHSQAGGSLQPPLTGVNSAPTGTVDGILQVFFLLSLVVNFYLGLLIRKLLTRYRSLLMNVRSQTA